MLQGQSASPKTATLAAENVNPIATFWAEMCSNAAKLFLAVTEPEGAREVYKDIL
jgi:hypothetical protein